MPVNPDTLRVVEKWPWKGGCSIALHAADRGWRILEEADSREEMDLKLALLGLETDWGERDRDRPECQHRVYQHRVWRVS